MAFPYLLFVFCNVFIYFVVEFWYEWLNGVGVSELVSIVDFGLVKICGDIGLFVLLMLLLGMNISSACWCWWWFCFCDDCYLYKCDFQVWSLSRRKNLSILLYCNIWIFFVCGICYVVGLWSWWWVWGDIFIFMTTQHMESQMNVIVNQLAKVSDEFLASWFYTINYATVNRHWRLLSF